MSYRLDKTFIVAVFLTVCGFIIMGLGGEPAKERNSVNNSFLVSSDNIGAVEVPVQRIISITPLGTELIYALGCSDRLVGVDYFSDYPPEAESVAKVGSFFDTNFEAITSLEPDLIITLGESQKISDYCRSNNIRQLRLKLSNMSIVYEDILLTAKILGCESRGIELCNEIFDGLTDIRKRLVDNSGDSVTRRKVFLCLGRKPGTLNSLSTAGRGTCFTEMIYMAGGENIFSDIELPYADISRESLLSRAPDVIIEAVDPALLEQSGEDIIAQWQALEVPAVANGRVYLIDANLLHRPGVRMVEIAEKLYGCINE